MYDERTRARGLALLADGMSQNAVAKELSVSRSALRHWLSNPRAATQSGRPCPAPMAPSPAYSALFGYYLGDGHISRFPRYHALRITCDASQPGIIRDVEHLLEVVHPHRRSCRVSAPGCVIVQSNWKHWPCLFPQHGPGRKHERVLGMTDWQWRIVETHPADFLRGLFHSDGCRVNNWATRRVAGTKKRYDYPRWQFTNESAEIMQWCRQALDVLDIPWRQSTRRTLSVSRREAVARLDDLIGPKS
jgi:hypothetical protein